MSASRRVLTAAVTLSVIAGLAGSPAPVSADDGTKTQPAAPPAAPQPDPAVDGHIRALAAEDTAARAQAADELVRIGAPAASALGAALADPRLATAAADVLARIGPSARAAVPQIVKALVTKPGPARTAAIRAAVAMGADSRPGLPALVAAARAPRAAPERPEIVRAISTIAVAVARGTLRAENAADRAALAACSWLVRHQNPDGTWTGAIFPERCASTPRCTGTGEVAYDIGLTAVATLAVLGSEARGGATLTAAADRGLAALVAAQAKDGGIGITSFDDSTWSHAYATLALATALRGGREPVRAALREAVKRTLTLQSAGDGGWGYVGRRQGSSDSPLSTAMLDGLLMAQDAGLEVPGRAITRGLWFLSDMSEPQFGRVGYDRPGGPPSRFERNEKAFPASETESCTAAALATRFAAGWRSEHCPQEAGPRPSWDALVYFPLVLYVARKLPRWDTAAGTIDVWYWCAGSRALGQLGPSSDVYKPWRDSLHKALLPKQQTEKAGCAAGSWDPVDAWSPAGGRVFTTAFAAMALQACAPDSPGFAAALGDLRPSWKELEKSRSDPDPDVAAVARRGSDSIREALFR